MKNHSSIDMTWDSIKSSVESEESKSTVNVAADQISLTIEKK